MPSRPRLLLTLGDVAGIGPEVVARAWQNPVLHELCRPIVVGDVGHLRRIMKTLQIPGEVSEEQDISQADATPTRLICLQATDQDLSEVVLGRVSPEAGRAGYDFLCRAIDLTVAGEADGIVTAPIHKEGLRAAGLPYPGHTEILAERTGTRRFAMMLYYEGLGVTHVTLHMALREVFQHLRPESVLEKIELTDNMLTRLLGRRPCIGVCALNPHASDGGLFGCEEAEIIAPAIEKAQKQGIQASGPWPADTLFVRARQGEFDGIVAIYHDQGHIPLKLLGGHRAVNISLGLPLVRTSVAHGTAYDIAGQGKADETSMIEAVRIAARLAVASHSLTTGH